MKNTIVQCQLCFMWVYFCKKKLLLSCQNNFTGYCKIVKFNIFELGIFSRGFIASTRAFNILTRAFNLPTGAFNLATRAFSRLTRGFELVTRGFELVTHRFELVTREFELVTRFLIFHAQI